MRDIAVSDHDNAALSVATAFSDAVGHHEAGRLKEAEEAYRTAIRSDPRHADSLHGLGLLAHQAGRNEEALALIRQAIALSPAITHYHSNLGVILEANGDLAGAGTAYNTALQIDPNHPAAHNNLGTILEKQGRLVEAERHYRAAVRSQFDYPDAHNNLGAALQRFGRLAEAEEEYRCAIRQMPAYAEARNNLGAVLQLRQRHVEARHQYLTALRLRPHYPDALYNLGCLGLASADFTAAVECFRKALLQGADFHYVHNDLAVALQMLGRLDEAAEEFSAAVRREPQYAEGYSNLGNVQRDLHHLEEAEANIRTGLRLRPDDPVAHANLALLLLLTGRLAEAWPEFEFRWQTQILRAGARNYRQPQWKGEEIDARVVLVYAEQGLGDTIQFCRYIPMIQPGARIILEVPQPLASLLSGLPGVEQLIRQGDAPPPFDLHCPLVSLPLAFNTTIETIPDAVPYLAADPARSAVWTERLADLPGPRVGLVWAGGTRPDQPDANAIDRRRSIPLSALAPLAEITGCSFISLQKGDAARQAGTPPRGMVLHDFTDQLEDFSDTAALVENLDLVISVDTAVAHLAGALGKPVWLLNRFDTCWRWLLDREDSPWYPTLRQFRQPTMGDWGAAIEKVRDELRRLCEGDASGLSPR